MTGQATFPNVKLFSALLYKEEVVEKEALTILEGELGTIEKSTAPVDFNWTQYYPKEMGTPLFRKFILFSPLIHVSRLASIKLFTNRVEDAFRNSKTLNRSINIDPGYFTLDKAVLATTKNFSHRIYLENGIFAELTYRHINKTFNCLDWTYPEYRQERIVSLFNNWRDSLKIDKNYTQLNKTSKRYS